MASDNRFIDLHPCAVSGDMPENVKILIARCAVGEDVFANDDISLSLRFGELLWRRLLRMAEHYERQSDLFSEGDIRGPMMALAAKDMRFVLSDCARDL